MDRLILLRHAKTQTRAPSGDDFDRALTERGRRDALLIAGALAAAGHAPDVALVSSAVRAMQTWAAAAPCFPEAVLNVAPALYNADAGEVLGLARAEAKGARTVLVIGHNPGLHLLSVRLALQSAAPPAVLTELDNGFPTAAASVITFDPPSFTLLTPKALGGGA